MLIQVILQPENKFLKLAQYFFLFWTGNWDAVQRTQWVNKYIVYT